MVEEYKVLLNRIDKKIFRYQSYINSAQNLKSNGLKNSLDQLLELKIVDDPELLSLKYIFCFIKYSEETPKGVDYTFMSQHYANTLKIIPEHCKAQLIPFLSKIYFKALSKELEAENLKNYIKWINVYSFLKSKKIVCLPYKDNLESNILYKIKNFTKGLESNIKKNPLDKTFISQNRHKVNLDSYLECLDVVLEAKNNNLKIDTIESHLFSSIFSYLDTTYELSQSKQILGCNEVKILVEKLKGLNLNSDLEKLQLKKLDKFFCSLEESKIIKNPKEQPIKVNNPKEGQINIRNMTFIRTIFSNSKNPNFSVSIDQYDCSIYGNVAVKIYEIKNPDKIIDQIKIEIKLLETFSQMSVAKNCFLRFFGTS